MIAVSCLFGEGNRCRSGLVENETRIPEKVFLVEHKVRFLLRQCTTPELMSEGAALEERPGQYRRKEVLEMDKGRFS
jgi:hypothetical protein